METVVIVIGAVIGLAIVRAIRDRPRRTKARVVVLDVEIHDPD